VDRKYFRRSLRNDFCDIKLINASYCYIIFRPSQLDPQDGVWIEKCYVCETVCIIGTSYSLEHYRKCIMLTCFIFRFRKKKLFRMKSQGVYITAEDPFIYVTTASSSLTIFRYENDELLPFTSDDRARKGIAHLSMPNHKLVLVTDRDGSVTGIRQPERRPILNSTSACFEAELPCSITRLCKAAIRPPWKQSTVPGIVERDLLGSAADGSLFAFSVITETSWRLLRFVQNMCQRDARLSYLTGPTTNTRTHLEPDGTKPTGYHVDGDILSRLVDRHDDYEVLTSMLAADPADDPNNGGCVDFDTADERQMRFAQLVSEAMEGHPDKSGNGVEAARWSFSAVNRDPVEVALKYIRAAVDTPF